MNKNDEKQNIKADEQKQKKSILSGILEVEDKEESVNSNVDEQKSPTNNAEMSKPSTIQKTEKGKKDDTNGLSEEEKLLLNTGEGINLIPKKSKAEVTKEKKKFSFSVSSMISLMILIILSLGVVFFNILSKQQLNSAKEELHTREIELQQYTDKIVSNEEILERIDLYRQLQEGVFSPREVMEYIMAIVDRSGTISIRSFDLSDTLRFELKGSTKDLAIVAKLWYLLGIDENIETINLESVGKNEKEANFSFAGQLNRTYFVEK